MDINHVDPISRERKGRPWLSLFSEDLDNQSKGRMRKRKVKFLFLTLYEM